MGAEWGKLQNEELHHLQFLPNVFRTIKSRASCVLHLHALKEEKRLPMVLRKQMGRDNSVGIATRYELDFPGIESWCGGEILLTRTDRP